MSNPVAKDTNWPTTATPEALEAERLNRKQKLAGTYRLFSRYGFGLGRAGHITCRDPILANHFWVNPFGKDFSRIKVSDLLLVNEQGDIVEGKGVLNRAAFTTHSAIHAARPDVVCAAHAHSIYGKAWGSLGRKLDPITQDACAFYEDHAVYDDYGGIVVAEEEGAKVVEALGNNKALIMANHGLITVGQTVDAAAWWFISLDACCHVQLLAEAAGKPRVLGHDVALMTQKQIGRPKSGWHNFQSLWEIIVDEEPDLLD